MAQLKNTTINDTGSIQLPTGSTAQRPASPVAGQVRFNTTVNIVEMYDAQNSVWIPSNKILPVATGGTITNITQNGANYRVHQFTSTGAYNLTLTRGGEVEYLIVAGGGGGGMDMGGGGGGGGVLQGTTYLAEGVYPITVGAGGYGAPSGGQTRADGAGPNPGSHQFTVSATNGDNSSAFGFTAIGGGYGGSSYCGYTPDQGRGNAGGSGGGASGYSDGNTRDGAPGTAGQGHAGGGGGGQYYSGGGGGAGAPGVSSTDTPHGGDGVPSNILGTTYFFGGGGGGSAYSRSPGGDGGIGGGGGGAIGTTTGGAGINNGAAGGGGSPGTWAQTPGGAGGANTGGGGGGGSHYNSNTYGGVGGTGIVAVRYRTS